MKLWIDADAAPRDVKEVCFRASERLRLETVLVANQRIQLPPGYAYLSAVRVVCVVETTGHDHVVELHRALAQASLHVI